MDVDGDGLADLVVGLPRSVKDAGTVQTLAFAPRAQPSLPVIGRTVDQNSPTVAGAPEKGDELGAAIARSEAPNCSENPPGGAAYAVSSPGESVGSVRAAGTVIVVPEVGDLEDQPACPAVTFSQGRAVWGARPRLGTGSAAASARPGSSSRPPAVSRPWPLSRAGRVRTWAAAGTRALVVRASYDDAQRRHLNVEALPQAVAGQRFGSVLAA